MQLLLRLNETPENFTGRTLFTSMFNDISYGSSDNKVECESNANLDSRSWLREKSGLLSVKIVHKVNGTIWRKG